MASEVFANVAESTLASPALSTDATLALVSGAPFPAAGQYRIRLDDSLQQPGGIATRYEIARATFNAGNVINGFRTGVDLEGTTAQGWPIGTAVRAIVTAAALANYVSPATLAALPQGTLPGGYTQITAGTGAGFATLTDVTGLACTVTVAAGRRIRVSAFVEGFTSITAGDSFYLRIYEGATLLQAAILAGSGTNTWTNSGSPSVILSPTAGSHTYKVSAIRIAGSGTAIIIAAATTPAYILAEDIGV